MAQSPGFYLCAHKGFQMAFPNGWKVSVMFGVNNYCEHRNNRSIETFFKVSAPIGAKHNSSNAEVAVFKPNGEYSKDFPYVNSGDQVGGWLTPDQVLAIMAWAAAQPPMSVDAVD